MGTRSAKPSAPVLLRKVLEDSRVGVERLAQEVAGENEVLKVVRLTDHRPRLVALPVRRAEPEIDHEREPQSHAGQETDERSEQRAPEDRIEWENRAAGCAEEQGADQHEEPHVSGGES